MELGAGFHKSTSHVLGASVGSRLVSLDWLIIPMPKLQISGTYFGGQNFAGIGGLPQSFRIDRRHKCVSGAWQRRLAGIFFSTDGAAHAKSVWGPSRQPGARSSCR